MKTVDPMVKVHLGESPHSSITAVPATTNPKNKRIAVGSIQRQYSTIFHHMSIAPSGSAAVAATDDARGDGQQKDQHCTR